MKKHPVHRSFRFAFRGISEAFVTEKNFKIQFICFIAALFVAWLLGWTRLQVVLVVIVSAAILALEMINSALETLEDVVEPGHHEAVRRSKDLAAGAVLLMSLGAVVMALLFIFP